MRLFPAHKKSIEDRYREWISEAIPGSLEIKPASQSVLVYSEKRGGSKSFATLHKYFKEEKNLKKNNKKGFTLAELLIVVAIIAVLTAIAIPVFTGQLEKSREATDLANVRAAYAQVMVDALDDGATTHTDNGVTFTCDGAAGSRTVTAVVDLKQAQADWQTSGAATAVAGITATGSPTVGGTATITWTQATNAVTIVYA